MCIHVYTNILMSCIYADLIVYEFVCIEGNYIIIYRCILMFDGFYVSTTYSKHTHIYIYMYTILYYSSDTGTSDICHICYVLDIQQHAILFCMQVVQAASHNQCNQSPVHTHSRDVYVCVCVCVCVWSDYHIYMVN